MNEKQKRVAKLPFPEVENAYVLISGQEKPVEESYLNELWVKPIMSFIYDAGNVAAEWEPEYGPIQLWTKCEEGDEGATEHYFYDYHNSPLGSWSQLAVEREQLPHAFIRGNYKYIFNVLRDWAENHK